MKLYLRTFRRAFRNNCGMAVIMSLHISVSTNEMQKMGDRFHGGCHAQVTDSAERGRGFILRCGTRILRGGEA